MGSIYDDVKDRRVYVSAVLKDMPTVFFHACATLRQHDRVLKELAQENDPETSESCELDQWADHLFAEADELINAFRRQMDDSYDHVVALQALIVALWDLDERWCEPPVALALSTGIERWLKVTPDTALRREVEYLANRPHVLRATLARAKAEMDPQPAASPAP